MGKSRSKAVQVRFEMPLQHVPIVLGHGDEGEVPLRSVQIGLLWQRWAEHGVRPFGFDGSSVDLLGPEPIPDFNTALNLAKELTAYCSNHPENPQQHLTQIAGARVWTLSWS
jgi:hypothetical protein